MKRRPSDRTPPATAPQTLIHILLAVILLFGIFFRFVRYQNRWGLAYDQARDSVIARQALDTNTLPMLGPFSSAGQFIYGPQWFWIVAAFSAPGRTTPMLPWAILTSLSVGAIAVAYLIGRTAISPAFGLLLALLTAVSPGQIEYGTNLTSPSMVGLLSFACLFFFVRYLTAPAAASMALLAGLVGLSINVHFQAIGLLSLLLVAAGAVRNLRHWAVGAVAFILQFLPLILFDVTTHFFESRHLLEYLTLGQYRAAIPTRWLTFVGTFLPKLWGSVIGGSVAAGYLLGGLMVLCLAIAIKKRQLTKPVAGVLAGVAIIILMLRYYKGVRFDTYHAFLHPLILFTTSWSVFTLTRISRTGRLAGIVVTVLLVIGSISLARHGILGASNDTAIQAANWRQALAYTYPGKKFAVYDLNFKTTNKSLPLVLYLHSARLLDDEGQRIGIGIINPGISVPFPEIYDDPGGYKLFDLSASTSGQLSRSGWAPVNPKNIWESSQYWFAEEIDLSR